MTGTLSRSQAEEYLYTEALLLDDGRWDDWLDLYLPDAVFWVPAWRDETTPTQDPDTELSLIYYQGRRNLEDRVWRARSGLSVASTPPSRVVHAITNVLIERAATDEAAISSCFTVHLFDRRSDRSHVFFGRYQHLLRSVEGTWRIARKKILLLNDIIPTVIDFYSI